MSGPTQRVKVGSGALLAALMLGLSVVATGGAASNASSGSHATPGFAAPDCPAQLRPGAMLGTSLLSDATHTVKRYSAGNDTRGGEIQCGYYDPAKAYNYGWTLYYLFKTDTPAQVTQAVADGFAPLGGWAHPLSSYCGVSKTAYAYVDCSPSSDADTLAGALATLSQAESLAAAQPGATTTTKLTSTRTATVGKIVGEVEFSTDGGKTFAPLTASTVLKDGDEVSTGYESSVTLKFGHGTLSVFPLTQLRVDKYTDAANIVKTQTNLLIGLVRVIEPHTAAIRSDFSVVTPTCNSSIRGSGMVVSTSKSGVTSVYTTSDLSYVKGLADKTAVTVRNGYMTTVGTNKKAATPKKYTPAALRKITG
jgi:hypothetical protein